MSNLDGLIYIDKPSGMTSHDVVDALRRTLKIRRIGHTGILDPLATGLLIMLIGKGTMLSVQLTGLKKRYVSKFQFGITTDTYDSEGKITEQMEPGNVNIDEFKTALQSFTGSIEQIIPAYSAVKTNGVPMYKLARKGEVVPIKKKIVDVESIEIVEFNWPEVVVDIKCSSGTYVRSIAHQLGEYFKCGAHLIELRRTEIGPFKLSSASTLEEIAKAESLDEVIKPLIEALPSYPTIQIKPKYYADVLNGKPFCKRFIGSYDFNCNAGELSLLMGPENKVLALAEMNMLWKAEAQLSPSEVMGKYLRVIDEGYLRAE